MWRLSCDAGPFRGSTTAWEVTLGLLKAKTSCSGIEINKGNIWVLQKGLLQEGCLYDYISNWIHSWAFKGSRDSSRKGVFCAKQNSALCKAFDTAATCFQVGLSVSQFREGASICLSSEKGKQEHIMIHLGKTLFLFSSFSFFLLIFSSYFSLFFWIKVCDYLNFTRVHMFVLWVHIPTKCQYFFPTVHWTISILLDTTSFVTSVLWTEVHTLSK